MTTADRFKRSPLAMAVLGILHLEPMHPYAVQRRIKEWGKDQVVNVGQRAQLYKTIARLQEAGLVAVRATDRDQQYPERTVYEITDAGRAACMRWITEMIGAPRNEFPEFPAALSFLMLLGPEGAHAELSRRAAALRAELAELDAGISQATQFGLPRVTLLEDEYRRAVVDAEIRWLDGVVADITDGRLTWSMESLAQFQDQTTASKG
ncbi:DNA-binding PadR family transcriptional regulator [Nocardia transvalensis]|uniref:DNA-binding PadR family transcriptional regulator n=1 Tax=Nocardia transvalensis TaxID=37333 RepID=A0A7W9PK91_9NOCA|nr:PadR family transcriptional regulator [Nocardia transvalensis]MBB5917741.1 DNA-binding PadR family transcriptional regulator [Nocardia transvalensis]